MKTLVAALLFSVCGFCSACEAAQPSPVGSSQSASRVYSDSLELAASTANKGSAAEATNGKSTSASQTAPAWCQCALTVEEKIFLQQYNYQ